MLTPYYQDESVTLYHGDSVAETMGLGVQVELTVTSPPYADLIDYGDSPGQVGALTLGDWRDRMKEMLANLKAITVPSGRIAMNVGDVCVSRRAAGRHYVEPLAACLTMDAYAMGWDVLTPIRWEKIANVKMEASSSSGVLGKPNQPGGIIKNDAEHILLFRQRGEYRKPTPEQIAGAHIPSKDYAEMFRGTWRDIPGNTNPDHPATFPVKLPARLIRMFSFPGDTVFDPFAGTGTTLRAAKDLGRKAIGFEVEERYCEQAAMRLSQDVLDFGVSA